MNAELKARAVAALGDDADVIYWVPGRIEFLGKHTDYAGGRSLLCAVDRGIIIAARAREDDRVHVRDVVVGGEVDSRLDPTLVPRVGHWGLYIDVVARRLAANFGADLRGADVVIASDLPMAAGISSSSALVVAVALTLAKLNRLEERGEWRANIGDNDALAGYLSCVENGFSFGTLDGDRGVGPLSGSEDQTALLQSRPGALVQYSFAPVRFEAVVPLPADHVFAIASSGVRAEKNGAALESYNALARSAAAAAEQWRYVSGRTDENLGAALASSPDALDQMKRLLSADLYRRAEQFQLESESLIPATSAALRIGDLNALGAIVDRSQAAAESHLGNQIPETIHLARSARVLGAAAASAFGAGFGGSVWALVRERIAAQFLVEWRTQYLERFPVHEREAQFFLTHAGPPAMRLA